MKLDRIIAVSGALLFASMSAADAQQVGVAWMGQSSSPGRYLEVMQPMLEAQGIELEIAGELTPEQMAEVVDRFERDKDAMIVLRSNGVSWLAENSPEIPTFIGATNHPRLLGAIQNVQAPEGNITGVTYYLEHQPLLETYKTILPGMQSVMLLLQEGHSASDVDEEGTMAACANLGLDCQAVRVSSPDELRQTVTENAGQVDAFIMGNPAMVLDNVELILAAAGDTPVVSYQDSAVDGGALAGFAAADAVLAGFLAESLLDVVQAGRAISEVPVKTDPFPTFKVNMTTASRLGVTVPMEVLGAATIVE